MSGFVLDDYEVFSRMFFLTVVVYSCFLFLLQTLCFVYGPDLLMHFALLFF